MATDLDDGFLRALKTQVLFREANERIESLAAARRFDDPTFVCECADTTCSTLLSMEREEYRHARSDERWFVVLPEHLDRATEQIVVHTDRYVIAEKQGTSGSLFQQLTGGVAHPPATRSPSRAAPGWDPVTGWSRGEPNVLVPFEQ